MAPALASSAAVAATTAGAFVTAVSSKVAQLTTIFIAPVDVVTAAILSTCLHELGLPIRHD